MPEQKSTRFFPQTVHLAVFWLVAFVMLAALSAPLAAQTLAKVTVTAAKQAQIIGRVRLTGTLVARDDVMVNPKIGGQMITALYADIGDHVQKGDLLADLERDTLEVQMAQARARVQQSTAGLLQVRAQVAVSNTNLKQARTTFDRDQSLRRSGAISQARLDRSQTVLSSSQASLRAAQNGVAVAVAQLEQAKIGVRLAALNLSHTRITAPVSGTIVARNAHLGSVATPGPNPMFRIIKNDEIEVSAQIIETDISRLKTGDPVMLNVAGLGALKGIVRLISPRVDPRTRLGELRISLPKNPSLRPGLFASGWISTDRYQALAVPVSAVLSDAHGDFVLVVDAQGVIHKRTVKTGLVWKNLREIKTGLRAGETVILRAGAFFRDGDRVSPVLVAPEPAK